MFLIFIQSLFYIKMLSSGTIISSLWSVHGQGSDVDDPGPLIVAEHSHYWLTPVAMRIRHKAIWSLTFWCFSSHPLPCHTHCSPQQPTSSC